MASRRAFIDRQPESRDEERPLFPFRLMVRFEGTNRSIFMQIEAASNAREASYEREFPGV